MITIKINVSRVLKEHLYPGKNGKYLDLIAWENKNGPDQYGNTHMVVQSVSKEARARGEKGPILGNLKVDNAAPKPAKKLSPEPDLTDNPDDVPF